MLYIEALAHLFHHFIFDIQHFVSDDLFGNPLTTNNILLDETSNHLFGDIGIRYCFYLLGDLINSHLNKAMSIRSS